ncbi:MAG: hypothetical protein U1E80_01755 [Piscinibacter sp.]
MGFDAGRLAVAARLIDALLQRDASMDLREDCLRALLAAMLADQLAEGRRDTEDAYSQHCSATWGGCSSPCTCRKPGAAHGRPCQPTAGHAATRRTRPPAGHSAGLQRDRPATAGQWGWPPLLAQSMVRDAGAGARHAGPGCPGRRPCRPAAAAAERTVACSVPRAGAPPGGPGVARLEAALGCAPARARPRGAARAAAEPLSRLGWSASGRGRCGCVGDHDAITPADQETAAPKARRADEPAIQISAPRWSKAAMPRERAGAALEALWRGLDARGAAAAPTAAARRHDLMQGRRPTGRHCRVDPDKGDDLFALLCRRGVDTAIEDAREPRIAQRLPGWFRAGPTRAASGAADAPRGGRSA